MRPQCRGHDDFSESTEELAPLTEEERKQKLAELREKAKAKRANQALVDKEEQKRNEVSFSPSLERIIPFFLSLSLNNPIKKQQIRQKATKESQDMKEELQRKEQIKEAAKKRQEKLEEQEAKKRIKAKIEADKEERRRKAEEAKAAKEGRAVPAAAAPVASAASAAAPSRPAANHNEARLRLQTSGGNIMKTLPAETTLFEVAQMLETENGLTVSKFVQNFPKKIFEGALDFGKTLKEAGLVPSAALIVQ